MKWHLFFPLVASLLYVAAVLFLKRAQELGGGVLRTTFIANVAIAVVFAALLPMGGTGQPMALLWQPGLVAVLFVAGQVFVVLALALGEVSVATPVLGAKTIFVAWFTTRLLATRLPWQLWCAAGLSFGAIVLLQRGGRRNAVVGGLVTGDEVIDGGVVSGLKGAVAPGKKKVGRTLVFSLLAAGAYALFDVLVQKWSPAWGAGRFLPIMFALSAVLSLGFLPFIREPWRAVPRAAWPWLAGGAFFMALQSFSLVTGVAIFGDATAMNVVYSARGVWSVAAVWLIGHWFANTEARVGGAAVFRWRLAGAAVMTSAIVLVVAR